MPGSAVVGTPASRTWAGPRLGRSKWFHIEAETSTDIGVYENKPKKTLV